MAKKQMKSDAWIAVYQNGYALYHACGHSTVFPIHTCGAYSYLSGGVSCYLSEQFFEKEPWHIRLALEGEDRLYHNQQAKEQERTVFYNAIPEEWESMGTIGKNPLEYLLDRESREEILCCLTEKQKLAVCLCYFQQKTRKEAARELGITSPAVSAILSQAARKLRKKYPPQNQAVKAVTGA
ncbi:MAG: sigma-70 family RNA polymerase sigma factor [Acetatifactor muris]|nr:sigma-70 family RNA polymerase sigma factor [Acetatifactor muris]